MGKTCAVGLCKSGYKGHTGIKIHGFPDDDAERILWKNALNNKLDPNKNLECRYLRKTLATELSDKKDSKWKINSGKCTNCV